ncbi:hypothetical protein ACWD3I_43630 [Streptomyces sp. NPDC002817]|uniref:hypothetical protein n=1 Tax=Streptomyces sp. NPDC088357 TaxID=3154655 RepID=UPI003416853E
MEQRVGSNDGGVDLLGSGAGVVRRVREEEVHVPVAGRAGFGAAVGSYPAPADDVKSVTFEVKDQVQDFGKVADVRVLTAR